MTSPSQNNRTCTWSDGYVIDSLSSDVKDEMLFDIYDDLLAKYGIRSTRSGREKKPETVPSAMSEGMPAVPYQPVEKVATGRSYGR